jgi:hypothetical protein
MSIDRYCTMLPRTYLGVHTRCHLLFRAALKGAGVGPKPIGPILVRWMVLTVRSSHLMIDMIINTSG